MSQITIEQMQEKLVSLDELTRRLSTTEPLDSRLVSNETRVRFRLQAGWETELDAVSPSDEVRAFMKIGSTEYPLTAEGALAATSIIGLPKALVKRSPSTLIEPFLNYGWDSNLGDDAFNAIIVGGRVSAFAKPTITPFSNLELLQRAVDVIERHHPGTRIFADYKFDHSLAGSNIRLILPDIEHDITGGGLGDVPGDSPDRWYGGIHMKNSLVGKGQTSFEPYLFRWWCTNGATTERESNMVWARTGNDGQNLGSLYSWAEQAVEEVLGGMEHQFEQVQALTSLSVAGNTGEVLGEIFESFNVPVSQRAGINQNILTAQGPLTMYSIMDAISRAANDVNLSPERSDKLMRIGGALPGSTLDPLKARVYREGQSNPEGPNPYEVHQIA